LGAYVLLDWIIVWTKAQLLEQLFEIFTEQLLGEVKVAKEEGMPIPAATVSASFFTASGAIDLLLAVGDTLAFVSQITGTSPGLRVATSYMSISLM